MVDIRCAPSDDELVIDALWSLGASGVATVDDTEGHRLLAGFDDANLAAIAAAIRGVATAPDEIDVRLAPPAASTWREHATPHDVDPFWLRLPEHATRADRIDLCIEPGDAFGSGSHETTRLMLRLLATTDLRGRSVADIGCGTGVLAIAACHRGAGAVVGVDIDPRAVEITRQNAEANGATLDAHVGSAGALAGHQFDVVAVNVTLAIQREDRS